MVVQEKFRGTADVLLEFEGYEPYRSTLDLRPKWYEVPPFDLMIPASERSFQIQMEIEKTDHQSLRTAEHLTSDRENVSRKLV